MGHLPPFRIVLRRTVLKYSSVGHISGARTCLVKMVASFSGILFHVPFLESIFYLVRLVRRRVRGTHGDLRRVHRPMYYSSRAPRAGRTRSLQYTATGAGSSANFCDRRQRDRLKFHLSLCFPQR
jgi:hypothetical protein